jgi:hypothetical protein
MTKSSCITLALITAMSVSHVAAQKPAAALRVSIDVKPGDNPTSLEPKRQGMVPIAVLSSKDFDATAVDLNSIRAGVTGTEGSMFRSMKEDVDHDGDVDLIILFRVADLALTCDTRGITIKGKTAQGRDFEGTEAVTMSGC